MATQRPIAVFCLPWDLTTSLPDVRTPFCVCPAPSSVLNLDSWAEAPGAVRRSAGALWRNSPYAER
jgi:hypothetical protein